MPSPAARRRDPGLGSAKPTPMKPKPVDIGQPVGVYDTNSVREKVRLWQQKGGGVITTNDIYGNEDDENPSGEIKAAKSPEPRSLVTGPEVDISAFRTPTRTHIRSSSTPRKRVVSDQHWRKERSPPPTTSTRASPKRITVYNTNDHLKTTSKGKIESLGDRGSTAASSSGSVDDGITPPSFRQHSRAREAGGEKDLNDEEEGDDSYSLMGNNAKVEPSKSTCSPSLPKPLIDATFEETPPLRQASPTPNDDDGWIASEVDFSELSRRRARRSGAVKHQKGGILSHVLDESRKMFAKPATPLPPAPPANRGDKIKAWLSATPDPFIDDDVSFVEIPAPLNTQARRAETQQVLKNGDRGGKSDISADSSPRRKNSSGRSTRKRSSEDQSTLSAEGTVPTLPGHTTREYRKHRRAKTESPPSVRRHSKSPLEASPPITSKEKPNEQSIYASGRETIASSDGSEVSESDVPFPVKLKRHFPSTGVHRLSTIVSVETLNAQDEKIPQDVRSDGIIGSEGSALAQSTRQPDARQLEPDHDATGSHELKRGLTRHSDLMSVLSDPDARCKSIRSARSIRTNKSRLVKATVDDIMHEFSLDEAKYMCELRTLVDGVIPVLLTCVLSKSDSAAAAGLFRPSLDPKDDLNFTKPIVDMGATVERLKSLHKRVPINSADALLDWAQGAQQVYRDYLKSWRLGFQDVVVNLTPPENVDLVSEVFSLDRGLARDENGDVVDNDGKKVDVAYLLKRPLVRLKYLSKTFKGIDFLEHSPKAGEMANVYQSLVAEARRRSHEERARLEDESAAAIDATRARDPGTLAVLTNVSIDQSGRVLARDLFNLSLHHSSGQLVDCQAELLLRDNTPDNGHGGDLLICEVDDLDRWLLFPPIDTKYVSARKGDFGGEIVVMIRNQSENQNSQELLSLKIDDGDIAAEWVQLLGQDPAPPAVCRTQSFICRSNTNQTERNGERSPIRSWSPDKHPALTFDDIDVPIGEKATMISHIERSPASLDKKNPRSLLPGSSPGTSPQGRLFPKTQKASDFTPSAPNSYLSQLPSDSQAVDSSLKRSGEKIQTENVTSPTGLRRTKAKRRSRHAAELSPPRTPSKTAAPDRDLQSSATPHKADQNCDSSKLPSKSKPSQFSKDRLPREFTNEELGFNHQRVSSVPSMDLPTVRKIRESTLTCTTLRSDDEADKVSEETQVLEMQDDFEVPSLESLKDSPIPPPHRSPSSAQLKQQGVPVLSPPATQLKRRSSSPLKHEYEPSTPTEPSDSDTSTVRHYDMGYSSPETSEESEDDNIPMPLPQIEAQKTQKDPRQDARPAPDGETLSLPNPASQDPCEIVPPQLSKSSKTIASIFAWSERGAWESLFPDECSIVITPGLIEAYEMGQHDIQSSSKSSHGQRVTSFEEQPLISLELTPLVPIRRGTAIDISIRSPPTDRSKTKYTNNVLFRSRNMEECEVLYGLINHARINNPMYIALQNARGPYSGQPASLGRYSSTKSTNGSSWLGFPRRKNSYRASSGRTPSIGVASESSVGTMSSAFSALKWFGTGSKMFGIARSTITSRAGSRDDSLYSSSHGSGSNSLQTGQAAGIVEAIKGADGIGLSNAKIRLYVRETVSKWRDMGAARLTIMPVSPKPSRPGTAINAPDHDAQDEAGERVHETPASPRRGATAEKRIVVRGKTQDEILLDVCLGESSFERVARTGMAVSVWEENVGGTVSKKGGVVGGSFKVYMIQMKSEAEAAYTFGLVGKLRY